MKPPRTIAKLIGIALAVAVGTFAGIEFQKHRQARERQQMAEDIAEGVKEVGKFLLNPKTYTDAWQKAKEAHRRDEEIRKQMRAFEESQEKQTQALQAQAENRTNSMSAFDEIMERQNRSLQNQN